MSNLFKSVYWRLYIIKLSSRWIFRMGIGDMVWYKGQKYQISNGVYSGMWRLVGLQNNQDGWVQRSECKKVISFKNMLGSFKSGYWFYMTSWYAIWKNEGIKPWMKGCNIWANE